MCGWLDRCCETAEREGEESVIYTIRTNTLASITSLSLYVCLDHEKIKILSKQVGIIISTTIVILQWLYHQCI